MLVREGDRIYLEAPAKAEAAANVVTPDYYTQLPQIRLTGDFNRPSDAAGNGKADRSNARRQRRRQTGRMRAQASQPEYAIGRVRSDLEPPRHVPPDFPVRP